jgi:hypothetical protein
MSLHSNSAGSIATRSLFSITAWSIEIESRTAIHAIDGALRDALAAPSALHRLQTR